MGGVPEARGLVITTGGVSSYASISSKGTSIVACDDCIFNLTLPFIFEFGNRSTAALAISSNGVVNLDVSDQRNGCCTPTSIASNSPARARVAVLQTNLAPNRNGTVYYWCSSTACTVSYEGVSITNTSIASAQAEFHATGVIELRYATTPTTFNNPASFAAGVQDSAQSINVPAPLPGCSITTGICPFGQAYPSRQSVRFQYVLEPLDKIIVASMARSLTQISFNNSNVEKSINTTLAILSANLTGKTQAARTTELSLATNLATEIARAMAAENGYSQFAVGETARAQTAATDASTALAAEQLRAIDAVAAQTARAVDVESNLFDVVAAAQLGTFTGSTAIRSQSSSALRGERIETSRATAAELSLGRLVTSQTATMLTRTASLARSLNATNSTILARASSAKAALDIVARAQLSAQVLAFQSQSQAAAANGATFTALSSAIALQTSSNTADEAAASTANRNVLSEAHTALSALSAARNADGNALTAKTLSVTNALATATAEQANDASLLSGALATSASRAQTAGESLATQLSSRVALETARQGLAQATIDASITAGIDSETSRAVTVETSFAMNARVLADNLTAPLAALSEAYASMEKASALANTDVNELAVTTSTALASIAASEQSRATAWAETLNQLDATKSAELFTVQGATSTGISSFAGTFAASVDQQTSQQQASEDTMAGSIHQAVSTFHQQTDTLATLLANTTAHRSQQETSLAFTLATTFSRSRQSASQLAQSVNTSLSMGAADLDSVSRAVSTEALRAASAESALAVTATIMSTAVSSYRTQGELLVAGQTWRAAEVEATLQTNITALDAHHTAAEASIAVALQRESSRAQSIEQTIAGKTVSQAEALDSQRQALVQATSAQLASLIEGWQGSANNIISTATEAVASRADSFTAEILAWSDERRTRGEGISTALARLVYEQGSGDWQQTMAETNLSAARKALNASLLANMSDAAMQFLRVALPKEARRASLAASLLSQSLDNTFRTLSDTHSTSLMNNEARLTSTALLLQASLAFVHSEAAATDQSIATAIQDYVNSRLQFHIAIAQQVDSYANMSAMQLAQISNVSSVQDSSFNATATSLGLRLDVLLADHSALITTVSTATAELGINLTARLGLAWDAVLTTETVNNVSEHQQREQGLQSVATAAEQLAAVIRAQTADTNASSLGRADLLNNETTRAQASEAALDASITAQIRLASREGNMTAATIASMALSNAARFNSIAADWQTELARGLAAEASAALQWAVATASIQAMLDNETSRAVQAEATLMDTLVTENNTLSAALTVKTQTFVSLMTLQQALNQQLVRDMAQRIDISGSLGNSLLALISLANRTEQSLAQSLREETSRASVAEQQLTASANNSEQALTSNIATMNLTLIRAARDESANARAAEASLAVSASLAQQTASSNEITIAAAIERLNQTASFDLAQIALQALAAMQDRAQGENALASSINFTTTLLLTQQAQAAAAGSTLLTQQSVAIVAETLVRRDVESGLLSQALALGNTTSNQMQLVQMALEAETNRSLAVLLVLRASLSNATATINGSTAAQFDQLNATTIANEAVYNDVFEVLANSSHVTTETQQDATADYQAALAATTHYLAHHPQDSATVWVLQGPARTPCLTCAPVTLSACLVDAATVAAPLQPAHSTAHGSGLAYQTFLLRTQPQLFAILQTADNRGNLSRAGSFAQLQFSNLNATCFSITGTPSNASTDDRSATTPPTELTTSTTADGDERVQLTTTDALTTTTATSTTTTSTSTTTTSTTTTTTTATTTTTTATTTTTTATSTTTTTTADALTTTTALLSTSSNTATTTADALTTTALPSTSSSSATTTATATTTTTTTTALPSTSSSTATITADALTTTTALPSSSSNAATTTMSSTTLPLLTTLATSSTTSAGGIERRRNVDNASSSGSSSMTTLLLSAAVHEYLQASYNESTGANNMSPMWSHPAPAQRSASASLVETVGSVRAVLLAWTALITLLIALALGMIVTSLASSRHGVEPKVSSESLFPTGPQQRLKESSWRSANYIVSPTVHLDSRKNVTNPVFESTDTPDARASVELPGTHTLSPRASLIDGDWDTASPGSDVWVHHDGAGPADLRSWRSPAPESDPNLSV